ncbi:hypothetical protein, partial [Sphingomonas adhaesiva]
PRRGRGGLAQRVAFIAAANLIILIAAGIVGGVVMPLGMFGALAVMMLMAAVTLAIAFAPAPATPVPTPERIARSELKALPMQTARWLDAQRPALPAPAVTVLDRLDQRLDTLGVQLAALDEDSPAAADVRRLVGEQLPDFVRDYQRVPAPLRGTSRNGRTPDQQLIDGLSVIEREIGEMSTQLAQGDLDTLETRSRFLEIKYQGE